MARLQSLCLALIATLFTFAVPAYGQTTNSMSQTVASASVTDDPAITGASALKLAPIGSFIERDVVSIEYLIPAKSHTSIALFDLQGKLVVSVLDDELSAGHHTLRLALGTLPAGTYICRLTANGSAREERLVVQK